MNYDDWKQQTPENEEYADYECSECGNPVSKEGQFCSKDCQKASEL